MRVVVAGPGAIGSLVGALLTEGGLDVILLDRDPERARRRSGGDIVLRDPRGERRIRLRSSARDTWAGEIDLCIVCVKAHQTEDLLRRHDEVLRRVRFVWTIQNGIGPLETLQDALGAGRVLGGATFQGAYFEPDGVLVHAARGRTFIGAPGPVSPDPAPDLAEALARANLPVEAVPDIRRVMFEKFIVNVGINALAALLGGENGRILDSPDALDILRQAVAEAVRFAAARGVALDEAEQIERVIAVVRDTARNRNSLLSDLNAGRRTEIDYLNGWLADRADAPVNRVLARLVRAMERQSRRS